MDGCLMEILFIYILLCMIGFIKVNWLLLAFIAFLSFTIDIKK